MKRLAAVGMVVLICLGMGISELMVSAASGSVSFVASAGSVTVGNSVKLTITYTSSSVGAGKGTIGYDANLFQCTEVEGTSLDNRDSAAGVLNFAFAQTSRKESHKVICTFKSKKTGDGMFTLSSEALVTLDEEEIFISEADEKKSLTVKVENPAASSNANLASLKPSSGTLTPKFNANTTSYTVEVPYTTTSLSLSAVAADKNAKVATSGKTALAVGKNTQVVTVTAPSGATKKYTVVITRAADQGSSGETSTTTPPPGDPLEVTVGEETMQVSDTQPDTTLPPGYGWDSVTLNGTVVAAAKNADNGTVLLWLTPAAGGEGAFYLYDETSGQFTRFRPLTVDSRLYILLPMPAGQEPPAGTAAGTCSVGGQETDAFLYEDTALSDYAIVYVTAPDGRTGLYVYDRTDDSFQRYHTVTVAAQTPADDIPAAGWWQRTLTYARSHWRLLAVCAAGVAVLTAVIIITVVAVRRSHRNTNCRH